MVETAFPVDHRSENNVGVLPFYHIYGELSDLVECQSLLTGSTGAMNMIYTTMKGVTTIVMTKFEPEAFCRCVAEHKSTFAFIVPPILVTLSRHEGEYPNAESEGGL